MALLIEKSDLGLNTQLKTFNGKIDTYKTALGLTDAEVAATKADAAAFDFLLTAQDAVQTFAQNFTTYKNLLRKGGASTLGALPLMPALAPAPPMPEKPDLEGRFRILVQRIAYHPAYTTAIGRDLGIEAPEETFNPSEGKPSFYIEPTSGGYPNLRWKKGKYEGVEIWKDNGSGFAKLDRDMKPDYIDKTELPKAGTTALWKYKMIYLLNDEPIGNWSDVVSVTVYGEV